MPKTWISVRSMNLQPPKPPFGQLVMMSGTWGLSSHSRTNFTPVALPVGATSLYFARLSLPKVPSAAVAQVVPSAEVSTR